jgi:hypothetical protein
LMEFNKLRRKTLRRRIFMNKLTSQRECILLTNLSVLYQIIVNLLMINLS